MRGALLALLFLSLPAAAHNGVDRATRTEAQQHEDATQALPPPTPLPFDVGGPFQLVSSKGGVRSEVDPDARMQLLFFGYATCEQICSAALPMMGAIVDQVQIAGIAVRPVMITVDPDRDTAAVMAEKLPLIHGDFVGLTGSNAQLQVAYDAYGITPEVVFTDLDGQPIFAHGSFIYLLDGDGTVLTLIPPVLPPEQAAGIVANYAQGS